MRSMRWLSIGNRQFWLSRAKPSGQACSLHEHLTHIDIDKTTMSSIAGRSGSASARNRAQPATLSPSLADETTRD